MRGAINDPVERLREALRSFLEVGFGGREIEVDAPVAPRLPWAPHLFDRTGNRGWHCLAELPQSERWATRMKDAVSQMPGLRLGVCGPMHVLKDETVLDLIDQLESTIFVVEQDSVDKSAWYSSVCDLTYGAKLQISKSGIARMLDRALGRCLEAKEKRRKGVLLEVLTAVLLSQVSGFEVMARDISNRSQQVDVLIHNRNTSGVLRNGEIVIAEAKNWSQPVGTVEYYSLVRKIESRHGRAKLGFFVTTDRFTRGVDREMLRDSNKDILVVTLDHQTLPETWRTGNSITENIEREVINATLGE